MTTAAEVKRWTKSILAEHPDLRLNKRELYLSPTHHIHRFILFAGSSDRTFPTPVASYRILFMPPSYPTGYAWSNQLSVGWSTDPEFAEKLIVCVRQVVNEALRPLHSIEGLISLNNTQAVRGFGTTRIGHYPVLHAVVEAAMGHLDEVCNIVDARVAALEPGLNQTLSAGLVLQAKRPKSSDAAYMISGAIKGLQQLDEVKQLANYARKGDRGAIAGLLHQWEAKQVQKLGLEYAWQPTPFPLELHP
ncbi:hypothetical protein [Devosia sp. XK-2]|uniref:hypothetical protein n=1 Tax=Devosia sp. XK-2 TaxID=3126689 RepID=UPI0030D0E33D